jgi:hypothetical protein
MAVYVLTSYAQIGYLAAISADERVAIEGDPSFRFVFAQGDHFFYKTRCVGGVGGWWWWWCHVWWNWTARLRLSSRPMDQTFVRQADGGAGRSAGRHPGGLTHWARRCVGLPHTQGPTDSSSSVTKPQINHTHTHFCRRPSRTVRTPCSAPSPSACWRRRYVCALVWWYNKRVRGLQLALSTCSNQPKPLNQANHAHFVHHTAAPR